MRLVDLVHRASLEDPHTQTRAPTPEPRPAPQVGLRWGRPSAFSFSAAARAERDDGVSVSVEWPEEAPPEFMRIVESDLKVRSTLVLIEDPADPDRLVEVDRLAQMYFHYTVFPPKPTRSSMQPSLTTYFNLTFDLDPNNEAPK